MFQLVIVVVAITLTAIVVVGGVSYFNKDTGVKLQVQQTLAGQLEGLGAAVYSYKSANGGFIPANDIDEIASMLPGGKRPVIGQDEELRWQLGNGKLCLERVEEDEMNTAVKAGVFMFAQAAARSRPDGTVKVGSSCDDPAAEPWGTSRTIDGLVRSGSDTVAIIFDN